MAPTQHSFKAKLVRPPGAGTWTFVPVPKKVTAALGQAGRVAVTGTINDVALRGSMMPDGDGGHFIVVAAKVRAAAGVKEGDSVAVVVGVDTAPRTATVPAGLKRALRQSAAAATAFGALAYSHQKAFTDWIGEAKKDETKLARADKAVAMLVAGKKLKG